MIELFHKGGVMMYPILLCSIIMVAIILERLFTLATFHLFPQKILIELEEKLKQNDISNATILCKTQSTILGQVLLPALNSQNNSDETIKTLVTEAARRELTLLDRPTHVLEAISGLSPLLGLLGTVIGMIQIFSQIEDAGSSNIQFLSGGIYTALLTTAFGLSIAIPAMLFSKYFENRLSLISIKLENSTSYLLNTYVFGKSPNK